MEVTSENEIIDKFIDTFELHGNECRLCLKKANQIWELFENDDELPKKIMACAHVQVRKLHKTIFTLNKNFTNNFNDVHMCSLTKDFFT